MGCTAESDLFDVSPFCAPVCFISEDTCENYECPEGFEASVSDATGACLGDNFDMKGDPYCACIAIEEEAIDRKSVV